MSDDIKPIELVCPMCGGKEVSLGEGSEKAPTIWHMILPGKWSKNIPNHMPVYKRLQILCDSCGYAWMFDIPKEKVRLVNLKTNDSLPKMEDVREYKIGNANIYLIFKNRKNKEK